MAAKNQGYNLNDMEKTIDLLALKAIFWDVDFKALSWNENRNFIIRRVLAHGNLEMIRWLRKQMGDAALSEWLQRHQGGSLAPRQLRYWQVILEIPESLIDRWVEISKSSVWQQREA